MIHIQTGLSSRPGKQRRYPARPGWIWIINEAHQSKERKMPSESSRINRIASGMQDEEQIQKAIEAQKHAQSLSGNSDTPTPERPYVAPRTPTEKWLADTIAERLELEHVSIDEDFFEL